MTSTQEYRASPTPWRTAPSSSPAPAKHEQTYEIIVVDDEAPIAKLIAELLVEEGYRVRTFHDGASALMAINERPPVLLLLDIAMPVMTGAELLAELRRKGYHDLPIILMSAGSRLADYLDRGATDVIAKPFDLDELLMCVHTHATSNERELELGGDVS